MRSLFLAAAFTLSACGYDAPETPPDVATQRSEALEQGAQPWRCTAATLPEGWECCEENGLRCSDTSSQMLVCKGHRLVPLAWSECADVASRHSDPYGELCRAGPSGGWLLCEKPPAN
jgi:hypothetical protein